LSSLSARGATVMRSMNGLALAASVAMLRPAPFW
jgi:hypothetical protein